MSNEQTFTTTESKLDIEVLDEALNLLKQSHKLLERISFSTENCPLKKRYFDEFNKLPKIGVSNYFYGAKICESKIVPSNFMVWYFSDKSVRMFQLKNGKMYEVIFPKSTFQLMAEPPFIEPSEYKLIGNSSLATLNFLNGE